VVITRHESENRRAVLGLNAILLAQLALFMVSGLAWQGVINSRLILPPLERYVIIFSILWIGWLWAYPEKAETKRSRSIEAALLGVANVALLILLFYTFFHWSQEDAQIPFNNTWLDWIWSFTGVGLLILSTSAVIIRRPEGWSLGLGMGLLLMIGLLAHIFLSPAAGNTSSLIRITQLATYPLLAGLMTRQRFHPERSGVQDANLEIKKDNPQRPFRLTDPRSVHAWVDLSLQDEPARICTGLARAIAQSILADLCYIVTAPNEAGRPVVLQGGYDLIREEEVSGTILDYDRIPALAQTLIRARPLRILPGDSKTSDLKNLAEALGYKEIASLLLIPLTHNGTPWGGILLLSPFSNRQWSDDEMTYLAAESETLAELLIRAQQQTDHRVEFERSREALNLLSQETEALRERNQQLSNELDLARQEGISTSNSHVDVEALLTIQRETQDALNILQGENTRLRTLLANSPETTTEGAFAQLETELRMVLQEIAHLQNQLAQSNSRVVELEYQIEHQSTPAPQNAVEINTLIQDMRQPMSSILGYTDLLLAESLGILGKGQRTFVERIRSSAEHLRKQITTAVKLNAESQNPEDAAQVPVEFIDVIDQAVAQISPQLFEREIQLHIDMPDQLPLLRADRDKLQQIVGHLIYNAGTATPNEGIVGLRARQWNEENNEFVIFQVTDSGGGIAQEDLPRVFTRQYGAEMANLPGTGGDGVGLALAKTLTLAIGGRIWVESLPGKSTTFTVLLPTRPTHAAAGTPLESPTA
jgi:signal transduction histidine kinase